MTGSKWNKLHLTYRFLRYTPDLPRNTVRQVFQQAFQVRRRAVIGLYFVGGLTKKIF